MVLFYHLSLTCRFIPHRRAHKRTSLFPPQDFSSSAIMLFLLTIYVKNIEKLTYIASTKNPGYPHFKRKNKQLTLLFHEARNSSRTHTHIHTKENNEKLVLICPPSLYPQPSGPKLWTFPRGCLGDGW